MVEIVRCSVCKCDGTPLHVPAFGHCVMCEPQCVRGPIRPTKPEAVAVWNALHGGGWLTMESALKDGTWVLLYLSKGRVLMGHYSCGWRLMGDHGVVSPTHWQPLPAPPNHAATGETEG